MISKRKLVESATVAPIVEECVALSRIIAASRRTEAENAGWILKA
jgi:hypothetical protein